MSPEEAMGQGDVDGRADIYAPGCVLYEMPVLVGRSAEAIREAEQGVAIAAPRPVDQNSLYARLQVARVYVPTGSKAKAIETLEQLPATGHCLVYPGRLQLGPTFASLKGNPHVEKLLMR